MGRRTTSRRLRAAFIAFAASLCLGLAPASAQTQAGLELAQAGAVDAQFWGKVKDSGDPLLLEMYIRAFPTGEFVPLAHARIKALRGAGNQADDSSAGAEKSDKPEEMKATVYRLSEDGWLGAEIRGVTLPEAAARSSGQSGAIEIVSLVRPGPAEKAGLQQGDLILTVNGRPVDEMVAFVNGIRAIAPGSVADVKLLRGDAVVEQPVTIGGRFTDNLAAAEAGNASAQAQVGTAYAEGQGVEKDLVLARAWHLKAAEQGEVNSQVVVGYYYANGIGGPRNDAAAVEWYRKAAAANQPMALNNLAAMYSEGRGGLPQDRASAIDLFRRAAALGNELSANNLKNWNEPLYAVADIQRALADLGYDPGPVDGKMGGRTRAAIRTAQQQLGLGVDGNPSLELLIALRRAKQAFRTTPDAPPPSSARPAPPPRALGDLDSLD